MSEESFNYSLQSRLQREMVDLDKISKIKKNKSRKRIKPISKKMNKKYLIDSGVSGVAGDETDELIPIHLTVPSEKVISKADSYIVLGRDRENVSTSGYGGKAHAGAHSIDLVVGRSSGNPSVREKIEQILTLGNKGSVYVDPDFKNDAARIYLSQKSDIDEYFNLTSAIGLGVVGNEKSQSSIGLKADSIRVMSRNGIKLVAHAEESDSQNFAIVQRKGIDLISLPFKEDGTRVFDENIGDVTYDPTSDPRNNMQPIPKGENLIEALRNLKEQLNALSGIVMTFVKNQHEFNNAVAIHTHVSPFFAITVPPSLDLIAPNVKQNVATFTETTADIMEFKMVHLNKFETDYLQAGSDLYINSRYHHLN